VRSLVFTIIIDGADLAGPTMPNGSAQKSEKWHRKLGPDAEILQTLRSSTGSIIGAAVSDRSTPEADGANLRDVPQLPT
jgi:hypothetical protein